MLTRTSLALLSSLSLASSAIVVKPRQSVTIPPECDVIPTWEVTTFSWFNSSQNLDCANEVDVPNVCINATDAGGIIPCDSGLTACDDCGIPGCDTGLPLQPAGYGPPDNVTIAIPAVTGYGNCFESNPQGIRRYEVGDGTVLCSGVAYHINFDGDSNTDISSGHIDFAPISSWDCTNGSTISASGSVDFEIVCSRDAQNNATCAFPANESSIVIPVTAFTITDPSS